MRLNYEAYDQAGATVTDVIEARDRNDAIDQLRRDGLFVTDIQPAEASDGSVATAGEARPHVSHGADGARASGSGVKRLKHLSSFSRHLYVLITTGTPVIEALGAVSRQSDDEEWRAVVHGLIDHVAEGESLADAMRLQPGWFDAVYISMVSAGEQAGNLATMLNRLATLTQKRLHIRRSISGAMIYPAVLLGIGSLAGLMLLVFVVPKFTAMFATLNMELPPTTQALVFISDIVRGYWWALAIVGGALGTGLWVWANSVAGRVRLGLWTLELPIIGRIAKELITARVIRLLGTLIDSHVPVLDALSLTRSAAGNARYEGLIDNARDAVERGKEISSAFNDPGLISPSVYEAFANGEKTVQVAPLLLAVADFLDEENEVTIKSLKSVLEPILLVLLGALVAFVAISMFMPLFDLASMSG
ncbi:MAG: type II secretion system F family protein [Planctomycetota bacterium]|jgi:type II secretory pathway component PulF